MFEETRRETPKLVFKDQNLDSARNLLRQSLRRRLQSMDRSDVRRSIKARSLQRQCMLEAANNRGNPENRRNAKSINPSLLRKPTRRAPPPPISNSTDPDAISSFANIKNLPATSSKNIDLNHSLNGPNVNYESTSLIQIKKLDNQIKPNIPAKPSHLKNVQYKNKIQYGQPTLLANSRRIENSIDKAAPNCVPMQMLGSSPTNVNEPLEQDDNNELR